jgi:hypothetical protein
MAMVLAWLNTQPQSLRDLESLKLLKRVFGENFETISGEVTPLAKNPAGAVQNPHDPDAHWCTKGTADGKKDWVGYKVQVAETVAEGGATCQSSEPTSQFLTAVHTQTATGSDEAGMAAVLQAQKQTAIEAPSELYVDAAYVSGPQLALAQQEGRQLVGPVPSCPNKATGYGSEAFEVNVEERAAVCPAGKTSTQCSRLEEHSSGKVSYRFEFGRHCHECPLRGDCVGSGQKHRTLVVGQHHSVLQARRKEQQSDAFKNRMKQRNAIEGTQSELVRAHGMRRSRYRGLAKVTLQNLMIGAACNAKRWLRRMAWEMGTPAAVAA